MKASIYIRVSTDKQTEKNQMEPCIEYCKEHGYDVIGTFVDHAKSVYHVTKRPGYNQLMKLVYQRKCNHIIVWALDRWCRQGGVELLKSMSLLQSYDVQLHSVQEQFIEEFNVPGEIGIHLRNFVIGILGWQAKMESSKKGERVKASKKYQRAKKKGKVGRPGISPMIRQKVLALLKEGKSYRYIRDNVTYKAKYGKIKHISTTAIGDIKKSQTSVSINGD